MFTETGMGGSLAHPHFFLLFVLLVSAAAISDLRERRIPNDLVAAIFFLALLRHLDQGGLAGLVPSPGHAFTFVLIAGALLFLFARDMLGGGDVKMLAACALYIGSENQGVFFLLVALFGGLLAAGYLSIRSMQVAELTAPLSLPYGVAIASAGIAAASGNLAWML
ncbi:MAG TPA: prepilin peptidase [Kiloniellales bacterium]|nr:prepilin peptidase [Kiloniellales bacterium]